MIEIIFGLTLDSERFAMNRNENSWFGKFARGPSGLLAYLESQMGLGTPEIPAALRIESYREALEEYKNNHPKVFYAESFSVDEIQTAAHLLSLRDELRLSNFSWKKEKGMPEYLEVFVSLEERASENKSGKPALFNKGFSDRWQNVVSNLPFFQIPIQKISLVEAREDLPHYVQDLFSLLEKKGIIFEPYSFEFPEQKGDLKLLSDFFSGKKSKSKLSNDKSILIVNTRSENDSSEIIAQFCSFAAGSPVLLSEHPLSDLDSVFSQYWLPVTGEAHSSSVRPILQILPLAFSVIWKPLNVHRLLEFLLLPLQPVKKAVRSKLAECMSDKPGIGSERWNEILKEFPDEQKSVQFWIDNQRFEESGVPVKHLEKIARELSRWSAALSAVIEKAAENETEPDPFQARQLRLLSSQSSSLAEILSRRTGNISRIQLDHLIGLVAGGGLPVSERGPEEGHLKILRNPGSILEPADELFWYLCTEPSSPRRSPWPSDVQIYFEKNGVRLEKPEQILKNRHTSLIRMISLVEERLVLFVPKTVKGSPASHHPVIEILKGAFDNISGISIDASDYESLEANFNIQKTKIAPIRPPVKKVYFQIDHPELLVFKGNLSHSSLNVVFHHPYEFVLSRMARINAGILQSLSDINTIQGNISHFVIQKFLETGKLSDYKTLRKKLEVEILEHLEKEGAILLLPGMDRQREVLIDRSVTSCIALGNLLKQSGFEFKESEKKVSGKFSGMDITGYIDLVVENPSGIQAVIDLKWGGDKKRRDEIRTNRDLQLQIYSRLLDENGTLRSYYIISQDRFFSRDSFSDDIPVVENHSDESDDITWQKMEKTYRWRINQFRQGIVETSSPEDYEDTDGLPDCLSPEDDMLEIPVLGKQPRAYNSYEIWLGEAGL